LTTLYFSLLRNVQTNSMAHPAT